MSLIAWWPLHDGSLKNLVNPANPLNSGLAYNAARGKISAYSFYNPAQVNSGGMKSTKEVYLGPTQSMFCWVYLTEYSWLSGVITNHNHDSPTGMGLTMNAAGNICVNTSSIVSCDGCSEANHGFRTYYVYRSEGVVPKNQWCHIGYTFNNGVLSFYINGVQQKVVFNNTNTNQYEYTNVHLKYMRFGKATINVFGWSTVFSNYGLKGNLCDARVYDHALSKKEVQELSRALVLHYTFEEPGLTPNIFDTSIFLKDTANRCTVAPYGNNGFTMTSTGSDPYIGTSAQNGGGVGSLSTWYVGSGVSQVCLSWRHVSGPELNKSYMTFLNSSGQALNASHNRFNDFVISSGDQRYVLQTLPAGTVKVHVRFGNETLPSGSSITVDNICLKIGNNRLYSFPNLTYTPYNNVGGTLQPTTNQNIYTSSDAGVGKQSLECKGGTLITTPVAGDITQGVTISCWVKGSVPTDNLVVFADQNSKLAFGFYNNGQAIITCAGYGHACVTDIKTPWTSNWNHIVVRRDSAGAVKCFLNGAELALNGAQEWTHSVNTFSIGGRNNGEWTSYYKGLVDDVRVYHTALSDNDIKQLYQVRWAANKQGQVFSNTLNEGQSKFQIIRSGVNNCNQAYESGVVPSGYLALDGIKMERVPWINTGVVFNNANTQIMVAADVTPTATSGNNCLAGCGNSIWTGPVMLNFCGGKLEFGTNGYSTSSEAQGAYAANERLVVHAIIDYSSQKWFKNGIQIKNIASGTCPTTTAPLYIGTFKTPSSSVGNDNSFRGFIHFFEVKYGSIHKKFIPCKRLSDSVLGMYEINEGVFYSPEGGTYTTGKSTASLERDGSLYCAEINEI